MSDTNDERRLLAIMFTDVVGYTALTERDEAAAVRVRDRHRELVETLVRQFDGELIDATGDESLSIFPSALRAVDCALALQGALRSHPDLRLRIGVHLGDVLRHGKEVIGEGVNVAARIRPLAEPGGICVSEPVYQMVRSRPHVHAAPLGAQDLKNVSLPLPVYALVLDVAQPATDRRIARRTLGLIAAAALVVVGLALANQTTARVWFALNAPRWLGSPIEQEIAFATTSDGVRIAYATTGEGTPLVFSVGWFTHLKDGLTSPLYDSSGSLRWYSRDHLVVRYDGRGFGLSDRDVSDFSLDARVRDLEAVVDALGLEQFALCGISAGGPTVVTYADRHPERVTKLILLASFVGGAPPEEELSRPWRSTWEFAADNWDLPAARAAVAQLLAPNADEVQRRVFMELFRISGDGRAYAGFAQTWVDASEAATRIRIPTLIISGGADGALGGGRHAASLIPGARFEILEGADHVQASGNDPRLLPLVSAFLGAQTAPPK